MLNPLRFNMEVEAAVAVMAVAEGAATEVEVVEAEGAATVVEVVVVVAAARPEEAVVGE